MNATVHNPTHFEPQDYEVVDYLDNRRPEFYGDVAEHQRAVEAWEAEMLAVLGPSWRSKIHRCIHCGNGTVRWITAVHHEPTNENVVFGAVCTHRLGFRDAHAFKLAQLQARADARKVRFTVWNKRETLLNQHPVLRRALENIDQPIHARNMFLRDVLSKLDRYGELSDRQIAAVETSMKRDEEFAARKATEAVEEKGLAPNGRVAVTGLVLSTKYVENMYGATLKMLVKLENNAKVWCSVPSKETVERGDTITIRATWTVSETDKHFAFGSRPTLVKRVAAAPTGEPKPAPERVVDNPNYNPAADPEDYDPGKCKAEVERENKTSTFEF